MNNQHLFNADLGIDLGSSNLLMYSKNFGLILNEPSVISFFLENNPQILALGNNAKVMLNKTPIGIKTIYPLKNGTIQSTTALELMLNGFLQKVQALSVFPHKRFLITSQMHTNFIFREIITEILFNAGAKNVRFIDQPIVTALGLNLSIHENTGYMIINMGSSNSNISIISSGNIILTSSFPVSGYLLDTLIIEYLRKKHNVLIGEETAEKIKITLASALPIYDELKIKIKCFDLVSRLPCEITISSIEIREIILPYILVITSYIKLLLEKTPPDLIGDIVSRGIFLCGGGSLIKGLDKFLFANCKIPILQPESSQLIPVSGFRELFTNFESYNHLLFL